MRLRHFIIPVIIAFSVFAIFLVIKHFTNLSENQDEYTLYDGQTVRLVIGSRLLPLINPPIIRDNEIALDLDTVKRYIDKTVYWDEAGGKVTITTQNRLVRMNTDNLTAFVNDREEVKLDLPVFEENGIVYLPMKFLSNFFEIRISYNEKNKVVIIDDRKAIVQTATVVEKGAVIRLGRYTDQPIVKRYSDPPVNREGIDGNSADGLISENNINSADGAGASGTDAGGMGDGGTGAGGAGVYAIADAGAAADTTDALNDTPEDGAEASEFQDSNMSGEEAGDYNGLADIDDGVFDMYVFEEYDGWYRVRSLDGIVGYIEKKFVAVRRYVDRVALAGSASGAWSPENGKIAMVWEQVSSARANPDTTKIPDMPGLDVVSPTWFNLTDRAGAVESRASAQYIEWAHSNGYKVWALFSNTMNDIEMTSDFLNDSLARENAIRALLAYASMLDIDGINLDFENVYLKDKDALTQFIRELAPMLREQGLTFSVDVNVPDGSDTWSLCYDTPSIAEVADYINLMAYDQHGARGSESGSVSQLSWVEMNLQKLIDRDGVPSYKIILGIPFYTRVWEMSGSDAERGDKPADSSAVGMRTAIGNVFDNGADIEWDSYSGQFFCSYVKDGKTFHVWLEDPHSINMRSSLAHKYALAGVSAWSRNFVIPEIWDVLNRNLKEIITYYQWQSEAYSEEPTLDRVQ